MKTLPDGVTAEGFLATYYEVRDASFKMASDIYVATGIHHINHTDMSAESWVAEYGRARELRSLYARLAPDDRKALHLHGDWWLDNHIQKPHPEIDIQAFIDMARSASARRLEMESDYMDITGVSIGDARYDHAHKVGALNARARWVHAFDKMDDRERAAYIARFRRHRDSYTASPCDQVEVQLTFKLSPLMPFSDVVEQLSDQLRGTEFKQIVAQ